MMQLFTGDTKRVLPPECSGEGEDEDRRKVMSASAASPVDALPRGAPIEGDKCTDHEHGAMMDESPMKRCKWSDEGAASSVSSLEYLMQMFSIAPIVSFKHYILMVKLTVLGVVIFLLNETTWTALLDNCARHFTVACCRVSRWSCSSSSFACSCVSFHLILHLIIHCALSRGRYQMKQMKRITSATGTGAGAQSDESQGIECTKRCSPSNRIKGANVSSATLTTEKTSKMKIKSLGASLSFSLESSKILYFSSCCRECDSLLSFHSIGRVSQLQDAAPAKNCAQGQASPLQRNTINKSSSTAASAVATCFHLHLSPLLLIILSVTIFCLQIHPSTASLKVTQQGDILLGGIFPIHQKGKGPNNRCGLLNKDRGLQRMEAMRWSVAKINADTSLLPNVKLGLIILDTCSSDSYALNQSLEFVRASINTVEASAFQCPDGSIPRPKYGMKTISGVVGGSYSEVSLQVANLLRLFKIPQVSYASTGTSLSDKSRYDYFARTVPPDTFQALALVDVVQSFEWSYVSIVSSEGQYGDSGMKAFIHEARARNICIAVNEKVPHSASDEQFNIIFSHLLTKPNARAVVLFVRMEDARGILKAAKRAHNINFFTWVASDGWGKEDKLVEGVEEVAEGAITVELQTTIVEEFDSYMSSLTPYNNKGNPWFPEYWESLFSCKLPSDVSMADASSSSSFSSSVMSHRETADPGSPFTMNHTNINSTINLRVPRSKLTFVRHNQPQKHLTSTLNKRLQDVSSSGSSELDLEDDLENRPICNPDARIDASTGYRQETKVQFVVDAVYAFAEALHAAWLDLCRSKDRVCKELKELDGGVFYKNYLLKVNFTDIVGSQVRFDNQGDGLGRYNIYNYQKITSDEPEASADDSSGGNRSVLIGPLPVELASSSSVQTHAKFGYALVGTWVEDGLSLNKSKIYFNEKATHVVSVCSSPCSLGEIKVVQQGDHCCWICNPCKDQEYVIDEFTCRKCIDGWWPYANKSGCYPLPEQYMKWDSVYAIVPVVTSLIGILLTLFVIHTLIRYIDTPIVKASGRELSFILLGGILFCFLITYALLAKPSVIICSLQRFGVGFGFSVIYSALLTKTNRISRIFDSARKSARRPSYISPKSQVIICMSLVSIQVIGTGIWFVVEPPSTRQWFPDQNRKADVILKCNVKDARILQSLVFNMLLITLSTIYAIKTRKIPENFNESKFIGFTMYTTCIIWLAFIPLFFGTGNNYEIYIILFHPDKNVRKLTMNSATYKRQFTSATLANAASNAGSADQVRLIVTRSMAAATPSVALAAAATAIEGTSSGSASAPATGTSKPTDTGKFDSQSAVFDGEKSNLLKSRTSSVTTTTLVLKSSPSAAASDVNGDDKAAFVSNNKLKKRKTSVSKGPSKPLSSPTEQSSLFPCKSSSNGSSVRDREANINSSNIKSTNCIVNSLATRSNNVKCSTSTSAGPLNASSVATSRSSSSSSSTCSASTSTCSQVRMVEAAESAIAAVSRVVVNQEKPNVKSKSVCCAGRSDIIVVQQHVADQSHEQTPECREESRSINKVVVPVFHPSSPSTDPLPAAQQMQSHCNVPSACANETDTAKSPASLSSSSASCTSASSSSSSSSSTCSSSSSSSYSLAKRSSQCHSLESPDSQCNSMLQSTVTCQDAHIAGASCLRHTSRVTQIESQDICETTLSPFTTTVTTTTALASRPLQSANEAEPQRSIGQNHSHSQSLSHAHLSGDQQPQHQQQQQSPPVPHVAHTAQIHSTSELDMHSRL